MGDIKTLCNKDDVKSFTEENRKAVIGRSDKKGKLLGLSVEFGDEISFAKIDLDEVADKVGITSEKPFFLFYTGNLFCSANCDTVNNAVDGLKLM